MKQLSVVNIQIVKASACVKEKRSAQQENAQQTDMTAIQRAKSTKKNQKMRLTALVVQLLRLLNAVTIKNAKNRNPRHVH